MKNSKNIPSTPLKVGGKGGQEGTTVWSMGKGIRRGRWKGRGQKKGAGLKGRGMEKGGGCVIGLGDRHPSQPGTNVSSASAIYHHYEDLWHFTSCICMYIIFAQWSLIIWKTHRSLRLHVLYTYRPRPYVLCTHYLDQQRTF